MNSIKKSDYIAKVDRVSFAHDLQYHGSNSLRETFISLFNAPFRKLVMKKEKHLILDDISFEIKEGDILGVLGVNGVGKTTLCRLLANFYNPSEGRILVNGSIRAIFDTSVGIIDELTGRENAMMLVELMYPTLSSSEKKDIIEDAINFSELNEFIDIPYNKYSKGMQSRLCLSLISARPGDLLVLDEVFDGADQFFKEKITKRVVSMIKSSGASFIVSHNPEHLRTTCNRLIVIDNKKIVFDGGIEAGINFYNQVR